MFSSQLKMYIRTSILQNEYKFQLILLKCQIGPIFFYSLKVLNSILYHKCKRFRETNFDLSTVSPNADEQVQNASLHRRGGR